METKDDTLIETIGGYGRWQKLFLIFGIAPCKFTAVWTMMAIVFLAPKTTFTCLERSNSSEISNSTCYSDCVQYEYFSDFGNTIITEWDLICKREWLANFSQTITMFGILVGNFVFGYISDRYGRRRSSLVAGMLKLVVTAMLPFSPSYWIYTALRFIDGCASGGIMLPSHTILLETLTPNKRDTVNSICMSFGPSSQALMAVIAYYVRSWDQFILVTVSLHFIFITFFFIVLESPKWLLTTGKLDKAKEVMTKIAKCNRRPTDQISEVAEAIHIETSVSLSKKKASYLDLFVKPSLRMKNFLSCVIWFMAGLSFYGVNQYIGQTSRNPFITVGFAGALQVPGSLINGVCNRRYSRRITLICFFAVCTICNALLAVPDEWFYFKLVVGSVGVGAAGGAYTSVYVYTPELFPTVARTMGVGLSSMATRAGSMVAPFVAGLGASAPSAPPTVFALAPVVGAFACYFLPETRGIKLPDHIED